MGNAMIGAQFYARSRHDVGSSVMELPRGTTLECAASATCARRGEKQRKEGRQPAKKINRGWLTCGAEPAWQRGRTRGVSA